MIILLSKKVFSRENACFALSCLLEKNVGFSGVVSEEVLYIPICEKSGYLDLSSDESKERLRLQNYLEDLH